MQRKSVMNKPLLKALIVVLFLFCASLCRADKFCDFIDRVQEVYCPVTTTSTTSSVYICPATTTTALPVPEFCGEATREEIDDLIVSTYETFWDTEYRLISIENLKEFLEVTQIDLRGKSGWYDCDDWTKILLGRVIEWAPGIAFGMVWTVTDGESHAVNIMIDCNLDVWKIEPHDNSVELWDENSYVILLSEGVNGE